VPSAGKPQALNRYAYVFNNPLKYVDPSGHCPKNDDQCNEEKQHIEQKFHIRLSDSFEYSDITLLWDALNHISNKVGGHTFRYIWSGTYFIKWVDAANKPVCGANAIACAGNGVVNLFQSNFGINRDNFIEYSNFVRLVAHELGHIWDERAEARYGRGHGLWNKMAAATGSGPAGCADTLPLSSTCTGLYVAWQLGPDGPGDPTNYARASGREDFAEAFALYVQYDLYQRYSPEQWSVRSAFIAAQIALTRHCGALFNPNRCGNGGAVKQYGGVVGQ
jgi:hypothetical protein